jgi:CheY-like chemotaxis protein
MSTVLIVDDDPEIREALTDALEGRGYDVLVASHGREALDLLRNSPTVPCLIVLDLMMPNMDGFEFISEQKLDPKIADIPVVIITAGQHPKGPKVVEAVDVLHKPFARERLMKVVQEHCG